MFKQKFIDLCNKKGVSPTSVCKHIGLSNAAYSCWSEKTIPREATIRKIADYFNVTPEYLKGNEEKENKKSSELTEQEEFLLNSFRKTTEEGRQRIIQNVLNICDEIEKKHTKSDQSNAG